MMFANRHTPPRFKNTCRLQCPPSLHLCNPYSQDNASERTRNHCVAKEADLIVEPGYCLTDETPKNKRAMQA